MVSRLVVRADWWFTTPAVIIQPLTGAYMLHVAGFPLTSTWILASGALYLFAGACWLPVVWYQIRMCRMAIAAHDNVHGPARSLLALRAPLGNCSATRPSPRWWSYSR